MDYGAFKIYFFIKILLTAYHILILCSFKWTPILNNSFKLLMGRKTKIQTRMNQTILREMVLLIFIKGVTLRQFHYNACKLSAITSFKI